VREILRLTFSGDVAGREIARRLGIAPSTVRAVVERFRSSGLSWPLGDDITDEELEERLYGTAGSKQGHRRHAEPEVDDDDHS
jgi:transposase